MTKKSEKSAVKRVKISSKKGNFALFEDQKGKCPKV